VADLFALACCPTILATPISGYSHWAANALGCSGVVRLYGRRLPVWRAAGRTGSDTLPLNENLDGIDFTPSAHTDWL
jgi:hypothetical protein